MTGIGIEIGTGIGNGIEIGIGIETGIGTGIVAVKGSDVAPVTLMMKMNAARIRDAKVFTVYNGH